MQACDEIGAKLDDPYDWEKPSKRDSQSSIKTGTSAAKAGDFPRVPTKEKASSRPRDNDNRDRNTTRRAHESGSRYGTRDKKREVSAPPVIQPSRDTLHRTDRRKTGGSRNSRLSESGNDKEQKVVKDQIKAAGNVIVVDDVAEIKLNNENNNNNLQESPKKMVKKGCSRDRSGTRDRSQTREITRERGASVTKDNRGSVSRGGERGGSRERSNRDLSVNKDTTKQRRESSVPRIIDTRSNDLRKETHISATLPDNLLNPTMGVSPPTGIQNLNNLIRGSSQVQCVQKCWCSCRIFEVFGVKFSTKKLVLWGNFEKSIFWPKISLQK